MRISGTPRRHCNAQLCFDCRSGTPHPARTDLQTSQYIYHGWGACLETRPSKSQHGLLRSASREIRPSSPLTRFALKILTRQPASASARSSKPLLTCYPGLKYGERKRDAAKLQQSVDGSTLPSCVKLWVRWCGRSLAGSGSAPIHHPPIVMPLHTHGIIKSYHGATAGALSITLATSSSYGRYLPSSQRRLSDSGKRPKLGSVANGCETQTVGTLEKPIVIARLLAAR